MAVGTESSAIFIHVIISLSLLLFTAKIFAELFHRIKLPIVLGEILAGIIIGPYALGGLPLFNGEPLVILDETIHHIGELAAIVILFVAGLEITPREFLRGGASSFTIGALGVIAPFFVGYIVFSLYGLDALETLLIATALTATSIAISIQVLTSLGKMQTKEARLILGAAIVDDILAIAVLSVVLTMVQTGNTTPDIIEIIFLILKILGLFVVLLVGSIVLVPRILHRERLWKSQGSIEGITTAIFFGGAGIAALVGLSPIVGAFAIGMAVASTRLIKQVEEYVHKLQIIFAPLFFAIIGAQVDLRGINLDVLIIAGIMISVAIATKILGCGLPSLIFLQKDKSKAMRVGIGMISRGEVGLIIAGVGTTSGVLSGDVYTAIIVMVAITTIITPIWLKKAYQKELTTS
ncbi:MAG TPA: cation:proton antiporter [Nitrososphaeraceae archaeon]|jgi:Kef-type K+ transport system membrane component KefB|nr:cation:proton antiporter [Nitrososphaeraceae archaeon]